MKARIKNEDVFTITGRGVVITGRLIHGTVNVGDFLIFGDKLAEIKGIESFRKMFNSVNNAGDNIGLLVSNITKEEASKYKGLILCITTKADMRQDLLIELGI